MPLLIYIDKIGEKGDERETLDGGADAEDAEIVGRGDFNVAAIRDGRVEFDDACS